MKITRPSADVDVLVVGAGPTGLLLANQLGRRGVRTMIVDRHAGPARETRTLGVQARTLEIYSKLGIVGRALELGKIGTGANLWADRLQDWRVSARWNTELIGFEQHTDHVATTLRLPDGATTQLTTAWVAGCEGARSFVRERSGITFPGAPYEHVFFVADTEATGSMVADQVNIYLWRDGFHLFFPMRGKNHWRVVGILPGELRNRNDVGFDAVVPALRNEAGSALAFQSCSWFSTYRIHHRCASHFRERRCFLLGDAAHIHSPVGAQGMNTGRARTTWHGNSRSSSAIEQIPRCSSRTSVNACQSRSGCWTRRTARSG